MVNLYHRFNLIKECEFSKEKIVAELQKYKLKNNLKYSIFFPNEEGRTEERKGKGQERLFDIFKVTRPK